MQKKVLPHLCFWTIYVSANLLIKYHYKGASLQVVLWLLTYALNAALVYATGLYWLPRFYQTRRWTGFILLIPILYLLYLLGNYWIETVFEPWYYQKPPMLAGLSNYWLPVIPFFLQYAVIGWGVFFYHQLNRRELELKAAQLAQLQLKHQNTELEKEKLNFELSYLRSQLNPHFLFNILNTVSNRVAKTDFDTSQMITHLASLMRYTIEESGQNGKVLLGEEIRHLEMLIALQRERFKEQTGIVFEKTGSPVQYRILSHLLLTFAENAMKHGIIDLPAQPVTIQLQIEGDKLLYKVHNWKRKHYNPHSHAVGLNNIKRLLAIAYPGSHTLEIAETDDTYQTLLTLSVEP